MTQEDNEKQFFVFDLYPKADCEGTEYSNVLKSWFSFSVKGAKKGDHFVMNIRDLNNQYKLWNDGMRPVVTIDGKSTFVSGKIKHSADDLKFTTPMTLTFEHIFANSKITLFSFSFPYSYQYLQKHLQQIEREVKAFNKLKKKQHKQSKEKWNQKIYFNRDLLCYSRQGRRIDLLTISSFDNITKERETIQNPGKKKILFPKGNDKKRPFLFAKKKTIFISARIHSAEVPSSFMMEGMINFLCHKTDPRSILLRKNFVFKIIPMVNPDGVYWGFSRVNSFGSNLNRFFDSPSQYHQPSVYSMKLLIQHLKKKENLVNFIDLHGIAWEKGSFSFGNHYDNFEEQINNILFPKLIALNSQHFRFKDCYFYNLENPVSHLEGTGRYQIHKITGVDCYTIECNYNMGESVNRISEFPKYKDSLLFDKDIQVYEPEKLPKFTPVIMKDIGKSICLGLLDCYAFETNQYSRLHSIGLKNLDELKKGIEKEIKENKNFWRGSRIDD